MRYEFDWDPAKDRSNVYKHGVSFRKAATIFKDPYQLSLYHEEHSETDERWITIGLDSSGVLRVVVHLFEQDATDTAYIRIISARNAMATEERQYVEANP